MTIWHRILDAFRRHPGLETIQDLERRLRESYEFRRFIEHSAAIMVSRMPGEMCQIPEDEVWGPIESGAHHRLLVTKDGAGMLVFKAKMAE